ncbi:KIAA1430-like protein-domain-containing protein, partial [Pavlovales sp. CCMP2436]
QREQGRHLAKLKRIKPSIDNKPPGHYGHVAHNAKKAMMVDERYETIERSNRLLLERLQTVMLNDQGHLPPLPHAKRVGPASLNEDRRKRERVKVARENEGIVRRIMQQKPVYSAREMEDEYAKAQQYGSMIQVY